jgi:hypothetical protein
MVFFNITWLVYIKWQSDAIYKKIWLLCVLNLKLNSLWLYGIVYITWHLFILCGCNWPLNLKVTELTHVVLFTWCLSCDIWRLCVLHRKLMLLWSQDIVYITWHLFTLCGCKWPLNLNLSELNHVVLFIRCDFTTCCMSPYTADMRTERQINFVIVTLLCLHHMT